MANILIIGWVFVMVLFTFSISLVIWGRSGF